MTIILAGLKSIDLDAIMLYGIITTPITNPVFLSMSVKSDSLNKVKKRKLQQKHKSVGRLSPITTPRGVAFCRVV